MSGARGRTGAGPCTGGGPDPAAVPPPTTSAGNPRPSPPAPQPPSRERRKWSKRAAEAVARAARPERLGCRESIRVARKQRAVRVRVC